MADISSITLPGGGTYDLKDKNAVHTSDVDAIPTANSTNPVQSGGVYTDVRTRVPVYGMGDNLLDNAYFVGGGSQLGHGIFPINQRGNSVYSGGTPYGIDRWFKVNCTVTVESDGIKLTKTNTELMRQHMSSAFWKSLLGKTVTLSVLGSDGLASTTFTMPSTLGSWDTTGPVLNNLQVDIYGNASVDSECFIRIFSLSPNGTEWKLYAVRLELGTEQTLAHLEGSTWVLNEIPDYEEELIKCQTSTADSSDTFANKSLATEQQLANVETGTTASRAYAVGESFCWNGLLYRVTQAISSGGTLTPGTNCAQKTVMESFAGFHIMLFTGTTPNDTSAYNQATGANYSLSTLIGFSVQNKTNAGWYDVPYFHAFLQNGNLRFSVPSDQVNVYGNCPFRAYILTV